MVTFNVVASGDDGFWEPVFSDLNSTFSGPPLNEDADGVAWCRFSSVAIPQGATITAATITIIPTGTLSSSPVTVAIKAFAEDDAVNPANFAAAAAKVYTSASVAWALANTVNGTPLVSPSITTVIQEVINRSGWASGNHLAIALANTGPTTPGLSIYSYDADPDAAAILTVTWTGGGGGGSAAVVQAGMTGGMASLNGGING